MTPRERESLIDEVTDQIVSLITHPPREIIRLWAENIVQTVKLRESHGWTAARIGRLEHMKKRGPTVVANAPTDHQNAMENASATERAAVVNARRQPRQAQ